MVYQLTEEEAEENLKKEHDWIKEDIHFSKQN